MSRARTLSVSGRVDGFDMWGEAYLPARPAEGVAYFFLYDCASGGSVSPKSGEIWEYIGGEWQRWEGDIWASLDDLLNRH